MTEPLALDDALASGLLIDERFGFRASHPLLAAAHLMLAESATHQAAHDEHVQRAIDHSVDDPQLRANALAKKALELAISHVQRIREAEAFAREALSVARSAGAEVDGRVAVALAWTRVLGGTAIGDRVQGIETLPVGSSLVQGAIGRPAAVRLAFRGEVAEARAAFERRSALADRRGEAFSVAAFHVQRCELELRAGDAVAASRLLSEWEQWTAATAVSLEPLRRRLEALLAAIRGLPDRAKSEAAAMLESVAVDSGYMWDMLEAKRATGIAALFERDCERAVASLTEIWEHTVREGVDDPGAFPVAADLVEALVEAGRIEAAGEVVERLARLAVAQRHPWGLTTLKRCEAVIGLAGQAVDAAAVALAEAAARYGELGLGFDQARSLLFLGRAQRRHKKRGDARRSLEQAQARFTQLGCDGWAALAAAELARVSGRRPGEGGRLTPSERRVAELAASGLTNRQIAARLVVSVYTVEGHLKHVYAKLEVSSRNQLAAMLKDST